MWPAPLSVLETVQAPRITPTRRHSLIAMLAIALCALLCGADSGALIEAYGKAKQA